MICGRCCAWLKGKQEQPTAAIFDGRTLQSTPESGERAGYDGYKRKKGSKIHMAVDTLGYLLALKVTPANEQERQQVADLAAAVQEATDGPCRSSICRPGIHRRPAPRCGAGSGH